LVYKSLNLNFKLLNFKFQWQVEISFRNFKNNHLARIGI
jgi:hypothetical protein